MKVFLIGLIMLMSATWSHAAELSAERFGLAIVDVETTGLDADTHEMIDIGAIYVDLEGRELGRFFVRIHPAHPERADAGAQAVNGYSVERWRTLEAVTQAEALRQFEAFHQRIGADRTMILTAFNAWFDQAFVSRWMARDGRSFRNFYYYQVLDLPSMAWGRGLRAVSGTDLAKALGIPDETRDPLLHTGATGAQFNLELYRRLRLSL